ncbi:MAG: DHA2 family efflux MFS transporter permease subunit, partial [Acidobacteriota bacterium]|nr:DHA2 family efflux MFS transporter permease subunit [Acidobacteriota bacterium]
TRTQIRHAPPAPAAKRGGRRLMLILLLASQFMALLNVTIVNVAMPTMRVDLPASGSELQLIVAGYTVSYAMLLITGARLGDLFGRRRMFLAGLALFTLASLLCGLAQNAGMLIAARFVQGAGAALMNPSTLAIISATFPPHQRGMAIGIWAGVSALALAIGPLVGGLITEHLDWSWIFYINVPVGALAVFMANAFVEDPPYIRAQRPGRIDYVGFGLMAVGLASLQLILDKGQEEDWFSSPVIMWATVFAVAALAAFVIWELRSDEPIVNLRILKNRNFAVGTMLIALMGVVLYGSIALLPLFLQTLLGYPATASGMAVSPRGFGSILSMLVVGRLVGRVDGRYLIMFGFSVLAFSTYMLAGLNLDIAMSNVVWPNIISGCAMGFIFVPLTTMAMGTLPNEQMGNASGVYNLMRNTGGSIGIAAVTTMLSRGAQAHQAAISAHLTPYDPAFQQWMRQFGVAVGGAIGGGGGFIGGMPSQRALASAYGIVLRQSMLMSFVDNFRLLAFLCVLCIPAALLFKRVRARGGPSVGGH